MLRTLPLEREQGIRPGLMMQSYFTVSLTGYAEALSPVTNARIPGAFQLWGKSKTTILKIPFFD
jgi:hypothetical protein